MNKALIFPNESRSWIEYEASSDFPIQNIPLGICSFGSNEKYVCSRIGDVVINIFHLFEKGILTTNGFTKADFSAEHLNVLLSKGKSQLRLLRKDLYELFVSTNQSADRTLVNMACTAIKNVQEHLPVKPGNYTDFYSSREHAYNVGVMFRDPANALLPNWLHMPIGYHGRASSIVASGTPIIRPKGQTMPMDADAPVFGPSKQLDFELEMAFVIGKKNQLGQPVNIENAEDHIQGMLIFNDWSARDLQKWEYVPLGPFLGKNFASTVSSWLIDLDALQPFKVAGPEPEKPLLDYLKFNSPSNYDIQLEVSICPEEGEETVIGRSNMKYLYWSMSQQLAHHTVNGCNMEIGDMCASGTISGPTPDSYGSMLEIAWKGTKPIPLKDGSERTFIKDGDTVIMRAYAQNDSYRIGFGEARGMILPSHQNNK